LKNMPPGIRRNQAQRELATYLYNLKDRSALESFVGVFRDIYYVNILSGMLTTGMRNFMGPLFSMVFEFMLPDLVRDPIRFARFWHKAVTDKRFLKLGVAGSAVIPDVLMKGYSDQLYAETPVENARALDTWSNHLGELFRSAKKGNKKDGIKAGIALWQIPATFGTRLNMVMDNLITPFMFEYDSYMNAYDRAKKERKTKRGKWVPIGKEFNHQLDEILAINRMDEWSAQLRDEVAVKVADGEIRDTSYGRSRYTAMRMKELVMQAREDDLRVSAERAARSVTLLNSPHGYAPAFAYTLYNKALQGFGYDSNSGAVATAVVNAMLLFNLPIVRVPLNMATFMYHWTPVHGAELAARALSDRLSGTESYGKIVTRMSTGLKPETQELAPHQIRRRETKAILGTLMFIAVKMLFFRVDNDEEFRPKWMPRFPDFRVTGGWDRDLTHIPGWRPNSIQWRSDGEWKGFSYMDSPFLTAVLSGVGDDFNEFYRKRDFTAEQYEFNAANLAMGALIESTVMVRKLPDFSFTEPLGYLLGVAGIGETGRPAQVIDPDVGLDALDKASVLIAGRPGNPLRAVNTVMAPNIANQFYRMGVQRRGGVRQELVRPEMDLSGPGIAALMRDYSHNARANTVMSLADILIPWSYEPELMPGAVVREGNDVIRFPDIQLSTGEATDYLGYPVPMDLNMPYETIGVLNRVRSEEGMVSLTEKIRNLSPAHQMAYDSRLDVNALPRPYTPPADLTNRQQFSEAVRAIAPEKRRLTSKEQMMIREVYKQVFGKILNNEVQRGSLVHWERFVENYDQNRSAGARDKALDYIKRGVDSAHNRAVDISKEYYLSWLRTQQG